jgi:hypothetical protein
MTRIKRIDNVLTGQGVERDKPVRAYKSHSVFPDVTWKCMTPKADPLQPRPVTAGHVCTRFKAVWGGGVECMDCGALQPIYKKAPAGHVCTSEKLDWSTGGGRCPECGRLLEI